MNFGSTEEQELLRAEVRKFLAPNVAPGARLDADKWQHFGLSWPEVVIGRGTPNVEKNIIAERILGLPKDRGSAALSGEGSW